MLGVEAAYLIVAVLCKRLMLHRERIAFIVRV
jgi:hypothetical protein